MSPLLGPAHRYGACIISLISSMLAHYFIALAVLATKNEGACGINSRCCEWDPYHFTNLRSKPYLVLRKAAQSAFMADGSQGNIYLHHSAATWPQTLTFMFFLYYFNSSCDSFTSHMWPFSHVKVTLPQSLAVRGWSLETATTFRRAYQKLGYWFGWELTHSFNVTHRGHDELFQIKIQTWL